MRKFHLHEGRSGSAIRVRITPRMAKNEVFQILEDGTVKIRLTAPPVDGKANIELTKFLAEVLNIPESDIDIVAGQTKREKLISILNLSTDQVDKRLFECLKK